MMETLGIVLLMAPAAALFYWLRRREQARRGAPADPTSGDSPPE